MAGVFVCYRRTPEVEHAAGRLYGDLAGEFGDASVFIDVDGVRPGEDWMAAIEDALSHCEVLLVLVHPTWTSDVRLKDPEDVMRIEIETALDRDLLVVPVLINDAADLRASELPNTLRVLARRQALPLRHRTWRADLSPLMEAIQDRLEPHPATTGEPDSSAEDGPPTLGLRARGEPVFRLQETLGQLGFHVGDVDGIYGLDTFSAVRDFQKSTRIPADGIAGPETWDRLASAISDRTPLEDETGAPTEHGRH